MTQEHDRHGIGGADLDLDLDLDRRLAALTREADPEESTWTGIEHSIQPPRRRGWIGPMAAVAAALVAVIAAVQWMPKAEQARESSVRMLVQAEAEAMRRAAPVMTGGLTDAVPLSHAWAENQIAIEELETALERDPDNRLLLEFLVEARLRQVRLLNSGLALAPKTEA